MGLSVNDVTGIGSVSDLIKDVADKIWPDPAIRDQYLLKAQELDNQLVLGQTAIDQAEASSSSLFIAGWRPCVGWCCAAAFAYHLILQPFLTYLMATFGHTFPLPTFDTGLLTTILMGMLGLGTLRSVENMGDKGHLPWQK
jgi:hypothetical protein